MPEVAPNAKLRARPDLVSVDSVAGDGATAAVVKDPLSLEYYRLGPREAFVLEQLREPLGVDELTRRYRTRFPAERITPEAILSFCGSLHAGRLLLSDRPGQATDRKPDRSGLGIAGTLLSPLAMRLPGVDPTWLLDRLGWLGVLLFRPATLGVALVATLLVGLMLLGRAEELFADAGRLLELWRPQHAAAALAAWVIAKAWHELGHALACRRMGASCHDIGVMLLALVPCPYCDVSDAWVLPERWRRAVVAVGGVYFELLLAIGAGAAWLVLAPGPLRVLALATLIATTVSTLLVNLNPLLRFDGYYVLADAWGVANLREQSRRALWGPVRRWVVGVAPDDEPLDASRGALAAYAAASIAYSTAILAVILWTLHHTLTNAGFRAAGDALVGVSLAGLLYVTGRALASPMLRSPPQRRAGVAARSVLVGLGAAGAVATIGMLPVDQTLHSPCRLESCESVDVVAEVAGLLTPAARYGDTLGEGALVATIDDPEWRVRLLELQERESTARARVSALQTTVAAHPERLADLTQARVALTEARRQRETHEADEDRRRLTTPIAGRLLAPASRSLPSDRETLAGWVGRPLDEANRGCGVEPGDLIGRVASEGMQAVVLLNQADSGLVRVGDRVRIALDRDPGQTLSGAVTRIAERSVANGSGDRLERTEEGLERSLSSPLEPFAAYRVEVLLDDQTAACQPGAVGQARIVTGEETLIGRATRWLWRLIRFQ